MKLPALPAGGAPAPDAPAIVAEAVRACEAVRTLTAEVAASGKVSGQRLRIRLSVGVARPASARIEAVAPFGAPVFIFVATNDDATVLLPRDDRVLAHGAPDQVLDAAAGVPLGAAALRTTLTGCVEDADAGTLLAAGGEWRVLRVARGAGADIVADDAYLHHDRSTQTWQLAASVRRGPAGRGWRAEYRDYLNGLPRSIRLTSLDAGGGSGAAFDLSLVLSQVETNVTLDAAAFRVQIPASAQPITLEELRHARPGTREN